MASTKFLEDKDPKRFLGITHTSHITLNVERENYLERTTPRYTQYPTDSLEAKGEDLKPCPDHNKVAQGNGQTIHHPGSVRDRRLSKAVTIPDTAEKKT